MVYFWAHSVMHNAGDFVFLMFMGVLRIEIVFVIALVIKQVATFFFFPPYASFLNCFLVRVAVARARSRCVRSCPRRRTALRNRERLVLPDRKLR